MCVNCILKADINNRCAVNVTAKAINAGDGMRMKVPCLLNFVGTSEFIEILSRELVKHI